MHTISKFRISREFPGAKIFIPVSREWKNATGAWSLVVTPDLNHFSCNPLATNPWLPLFGCNSWIKSLDCNLWLKPLECNSWLQPLAETPGLQALAATPWLQPLAETSVCNPWLKPLGCNPLLQPLDGNPWLKPRGWNPLAATLWQQPGFQFQQITVRGSLIKMLL